MFGIQKLAIIIAIASALAFSVHTSPRQESDPAITKEKASTGLVTLYPQDPLGSTFGFLQGRYGHIIQDHICKNSGSDIVYDAYFPGELVVGIEGGRQGVILDLGTYKDLAKRYGYTETGGGFQGWSSLRFKNKELVILKNYEKQSTQLLQESSALYRPQKTSMGHAPVKLGHNYLIRITERGDPDFELVVKLKVVALLENQSVTIRWAVL